MVILVLAITAPDASVTVPVMVPRSSWPKHDSENSANEAAIRDPIFIVVFSPREHSAMTLSVTKLTLFRAGRTLARQSAVASEFIGNEPGHPVETVKSWIRNLVTSRKPKGINGVTYPVSAGKMILTAFLNQLDEGAIAAGTGSLRL